MLCVDPVTFGFDLTLAEYTAAVGAAGFPAAEWPVIWAEPGPRGDYAPTRAAFTTTGVVPIQFTCGLGVPGNLAIGADEFRRRLAEFAGHCRSGRAAGSARAAAFFDDRRHAGGELSEQKILDRVAAVAAVAADHGVEVVIGWHGRRLLELCGRIYSSSGGAFGVIIDTYTLARYGLGPQFVHTLPSGAIGWVRLGDAIVTEGLHPTNAARHRHYRHQGHRTGLPRQRLRRSTVPGGQRCSVGERRSREGAAGVLEPRRP